MNNLMVKMLGSAMVWLMAITLALVLHCGGVGGVELTFELPDNAKECFHEIIEKDTESTLEFQVGSCCRRSMRLIYMNRFSHRL